jgi:hypothetical protein
MSTEFWLGIFLSIPIGIGTSLYTPWFQGKLEGYSKKRALSQTKNIKEEFESVSFYRNNPSSLTQFLVYVAIKSTFIGAASGILSGFFFALGNILNSMRGILYIWDQFLALQNIPYTLGQFTALIGPEFAVGGERAGIRVCYQEFT